MNGSPKLVYLDSLRGLAALVVVFSHFACAFFPFAILGERYAALSPYETLFHYPPFSTALAGHFAVCLFFVLSGFVLSIRSIESRAARAQDSHHQDRWRVVQAMLKRPIRLGGVVVASVAVAYLFQIQGLYGNQTVGLHTGSVPWFTSFWTETPTLAAFAQDILLRPFSEGERYNPPLWTIRKELLGSYIVFGYLLVSAGKSLRGRTIWLTLLTLFFFKTLYVGFVIGVAMAEFQVHRGESPSRAAAERLGQARSRELWLGCLLLLGLCLGGQMHYIAGVFAGPWAGLQKLLLQDFGTGSAAMLGALLVFLVAMLSSRMQQVLSHPALRYLGKISYSLYALHFLLLGWISCALYLRLEPWVGHGGAAWLAMFLTLMTLIPAAHLLTITVDAWATALSGWIAHRLVAAIKLRRPSHSPRIFRINAGPATAEIKRSDAA